MEKEGRIKIAPVHKSYVDQYVKSVRKGQEEEGYILKIEDVETYLLNFYNHKEK